MNTLRTISWVMIIGLGFIWVSTGCSPNAKEVKDLKTRVAALEKKMNELEVAGSPVKAQTDQRARQAALHEKFTQRFEQDRKTYTEEQLSEAEKMYQVANKKWGSPESIESLKGMIERYPHLNRTGCASLYLAQHSTGQEAEKAFKNCIENFNDCYYGDGVQVGAYARFLLANYYKNAQEPDKAVKLYKEIQETYPDSIDHSGRLLISLIQ